jgi:hypothetical protein
VPSRFKDFWRCDRAQKVMFSKTLLAAMVMAAESNADIAAKIIVSRQVIASGKLGAVFFLFPAWHSARSVYAFPIGAEDRRQLAGPEHRQPWGAQQPPS